MLHIENVTFLTKQDILVYSHLRKGDRNNGQCQETPTRSSRSVEDNRFCRSRSSRATACQFVLINQLGAGVNCLMIF